MYNNDWHGEDIDHDEVREIESEAMDRLKSEECFLDEQQAAEQRIGA